MTKAKVKTRAKAATKKEKLTRRIIPLLNWWTEFLGIAQVYQINIGVLDDIPGYAPGGRTRAMTVRVEHPYRQISLLVSEEMVTPLNDQELEKAVVHEMVHIIILPVSELVAGVLAGPAMEGIDHQEEMICDSVAQYFMRLKYGKEYSPITIHRDIESCLDCNAIIEGV